MLFGFDHRTGRLHTVCGDVSQSTAYLYSSCRSLAFVGVHRRLSAHSLFLRVQGFRVGVWDNVLDTHILGYWRFILVQNTMRAALKTS